MVHDPADIEEQRRVEDAIEAATIGLEVAVLAVIAKRLGKIEGKSLVEVYAAMPEDTAAIKKIIESGITNIQQIATEAMEQMAKGNDEWARKFYEAGSKEQVSALEHSEMREVLDRETKRATKEVDALCRSSVIEILDTKTGEILPIETAYKQVVSKAATSMTTGAKTGQEAISQAVRTLSKSGLRVVYRSGVTRNLYSAVSMNVMDSYRIAMGQMREIQGQEFGADGVEVSAHALCAPDHEEYQGMQYSYERRRGYRMWSEVQFEPARPLVVGANCGHTISPILLGISKPVYSQKELRELRRMSNKSVTVTGLSGKKLTMTRYEASQYQRQLETSIRKANETAYLLEQAKQDTAKLEASIKLRKREYKRISKEAGLVTRDDRIRAYVQR